jgi:hypothetical protein
MAAGLIRVPCEYSPDSESHMAVQIEQVRFENQFQTIGI